jgi:hypothetical protein
MEDSGVLVQPFREAGVLFVQCHGVGQH